MMKFIPGVKVYVRYSADVYQPFGEWLTVERYEKGLLYFKEKTPYEAIDCRTASFYGFGYSLAGSTLVTAKRWHIPFAAIAQKFGLLLPAGTIRNMKTTLHPVGKYTRLKPDNG